MENQGVTAADLVPRLIEEFDYPPAGARSLAQKLVALSPAVKEVFVEWWCTGDLDTELEIEEYTLKRLIEERSLKPIAAFLTLNWLLREPATARPVVDRGYDRIKV